MGEQLQIVVGGQGGTGDYNDSPYGGGGGGGSFVLTLSDKPSPLP